MKRQILQAWCVLALGLLASSAQAQFTWTGNNNLNSAQTYDGLGVDSALNPYSMGTTGDGDYIGSGSGSTGSLTVKSGSLTITNSDFKVGVSGGTGSLILGTNATLNVLSIGSWGPGIGQNSSSMGILIVSNNATLTFDVAGSNERRLTWGINTATNITTILGGTVNVTNGTGPIEDQGGFSLGAQNGYGTVNLLAGSINDSMPLPFGLGGQYNSLTTVPAWVDSTTTSSLIISNGTFVMTNICPTTDNTKSTFHVGTNSYVVFLAGTGSLSLNNWQSSDYAALVNAGLIRIGLPGQTPLVTTMASFNYSSSGGQGILSVITPFAFPPVIGTQPQSQDVVTGTTIQMSVVASGNAPLSYQWKLNNVNIQSLSDSANFTGATSNVLTILSAAAIDAGSYKVVVTNPYGNTTSSNGVLVVNAPTLIGQWVGGSTSLADVSGYSLAANHTAMVVGAGNYVFTNDVPTGKSGQSLFLYNSDSALEITNSSIFDTNYDTTFDNVINNQFSVMFWAKGLPPGWSPWVSKSGDAGGWQVRPDGNSANYPCFTVRGSGGSTTLGVGGEDLGTRSFPVADGTWHLYTGTFDAITGVRNFYVDNVLVASATGNVKYTLGTGAHLCIGGRENNSGTSSAGSYSTTEIFNVQVYNYAIAPSQITTEFGNQPAKITGQPQNALALAGNPASFTAQGVSGGGTLTYQWTLNNVNIQSLPDSANFTGAHSNVLSILSAATADAGTYVLTVTGTYGTAISSNATLVIQYPSVVGRWFTGAASLADVSGYTPPGTHDGFVVGGANYAYVAGDVPPYRHGQSLSLSGSTGIAIANSSTADAGYTNTYDDAMHANMTVAFWAKGYPDGWNPWVGKLGDNGAGWQMRQIGWSSHVTWGTGNYPAFTMRGGSGSGGDDMTSYGGGTSDGAWHQYTGTYNYNTGLRTLYRDGSQLTQSTGEGLYTLATSSHVGIGVRDTGNGTYDSYPPTAYPLKFYDVQVFNYDLTAAQVQSLTNPPNPSASNPQSVTTYVGGVARFIGGASGTGTLTNQWLLNGNPVVNGTYGSVVISGATSSVLTISNVTTAYLGTYRLMVSNANGTDTSDAATLTLNAPALLGEWFTGADSLADVSGYTTPGTHDAIDLTIGTTSYLSDAPSGRTGDSVLLTGNGLAINNSATFLGAGYTNNFDNKISSAFTVIYYAKGYPQNGNPWVSKNGNNGLGWQARTMSWGTNFVTFTVQGTGSASGADEIAYTYPDNNWHNYAFTYDEGTGRRTAYQDGRQLFQSTDNGVYTMAPNSALVIGATDSGNGTYSGYYTGQFYDVRVYNYPLTASQINAPLGTTPSFTGSPVLSGKNLTINWSFGTLLGSTNVAGPYTAVPGATAPYTLNVSTAPQMFYKLSNP